MRHALPTPRVRLWGMRQRRATFASCGTQESHTVLSRFQSSLASTACGSTSALHLHSRFTVHRSFTDFPSSDTGAKARGKACVRASMGKRRYQQNWRWCNRLQYPRSRRHLACLEKAGRSPTRLWTAQSGQCGTTNHSNFSCESCSSLLMLTKGKNRHDCRGPFAIDGHKRRTRRTFKCRLIHSFILSFFLSFFLSPLPRFLIPSHCQRLAQVGTPVTGSGVATPKRRALFRKCCR